MEQLQRPGVIDGEVRSVADAQDGRVLQLGVEQPHDMALAVLIKCGRRLVEKYPAGLVQEEPREGDTLLLAKRQLPVPPFLPIELGDEIAEIAKRPDLVRWLGVSENLRRISTLDREFHATILSASQNQIAWQFFETAQILALVVSWNFTKVEPSVLAKRVGPTAKQHRAIYDAIKKRQPMQARKLMRAHISGMAKRIMSSIEPRT